MPRIHSWIFSGASPARKRRLQAVASCAEKLPEPHNYTTHLIDQGRRARLETELAEFDFRYRLARGVPASLEQLVCVGTLLIKSCEGSLPLRKLDLDEELLINRHSFPVLVRWMEELIGEDI